MGKVSTLLIMITKIYYKFNMFQAVFGAHNFTLIMSLLCMHECYRYLQVGKMKHKESESIVKGTWQAGV